MNELGKRYYCETCHGEVVCTKPGDGHLECCVPMVLKATKPLPSSD